MTRDRTRTIDVSSSGMLAKHGKAISTLTLSCLRNHQVRCAPPSFASYECVLVAAGRSSLRCGVIAGSPAPSAEKFPLLEIQSSSSKRLA